MGPGPAGALWGDSVSAQLQAPRTVAIVQTLCDRERPTSAFPNSSSTAAYPEQWSLREFLHKPFPSTWNILPSSSITYLSFKSNLRNFLSWDTFSHTQPLPGPSPCSGLAWPRLSGGRGHAAVTDWTGDRPGAGDCGSCLPYSPHRACALP